MDLQELEDLFDDNDAEIIDQINNIRTYTVNDRVDHFDKWNEKQFYDRFRLTKNSVRNIVLPEVEPFLTHEIPRYHEIGPLNQLLITLRFYATGNFYITIGDFNGIHKSTAGRIVNRVTNALVLLFGRYIKFPENEEGRRLLQSNFYGLARFPRVIGAIDCTHIKIQSPGEDNAEFYRNRKGFFSLNVQAICDSNNLFLDIVARWPGSCHDSYMFMNSRIKRRFENEEFGDVVLLGDSGYPLKEYLMTPLVNPQRRSEEMYNRCHISTRTVIERTFGIWKRRFPILSMGIRCKIPLAQKIIAATAILHNVATANQENIEEFPEVDDIFNNLDRDLYRPPLFNVMQQRYLNYFETLL